MMQRRLRLAFCLMLAPLTGCQLIEASFVSISDSVAGSAAAISGSIESISRSSGSPPAATASAAYQRDVRAWTREFEGAPGSQEDFLRGIGRVAERHGLTDWEAEPGTLVAIGQGLKDAGWSEERMRDLRERLAAVPPPAVEAVFDGYRGAGS
jgi:hypothetical protein